MTEMHGLRRGRGHFKRYHTLKQMLAWREISRLTPPRSHCHYRPKHLLPGARRFVAGLQCALILGQCVDGINRSQQHTLIRLLSTHYGVAGSPC